MCKRLMVICCIATAVVSTLYSVVIGIVTYKQLLKESSVNEMISDTDEINRDLTSVVDIAIDVLGDEEAREWRLKELDSQKKQIAEFQQFVDTVIFNNYYNDKITAEVIGKSDGIYVNFHPIDLKKPCITVTWDYEYSVIERKDFLYNQQVYRQVIEDEAKSSAIKMALAVGITLLVVQPLMLVALWRFSTYKKKS